MRARRRGAQPLRDDLPDYCPGQCVENHPFVDDRDIDNAAADGFGNVQSEHQKGDEIEKCRPGDGILRLAET
jgi:hypothetical protein